MQALIELLAGFIIMLASAALAQFGVALDRTSEPQPEVRRAIDCAPSASIGTSPEAPRDC